ncbi:MAG: transcription antitermination factor NusB [Desulfobulbaceae bacterium S3730MH12]|nr:MAG: transcription antitermination factor NusB [Desulfobulbaceae bacterium S3730MH12]OEU82429.1 MAG: transcription antitermination factor NusB [Desulfobulbaceae bacterium C00003063]
MGTRRKSREAALQFLYQNDFVRVADIGNDMELSENFNIFCSLYQINKKARQYAFDLVKGILAEMDDIDEVISAAASHWRLVRIAPTDRNLLRIAVFEMTDMDDIPPQVAINEAVEIAKRFGGEESPRFINGILDAVKNNLGK